MTNGGQFPKSPTPSTPISARRRTWSPHQVTLNRRKKTEDDQDKLNDSFGQLLLNDGSDDDEDDYLAKSLSSIGDRKTTRPRYAGRRPTALKRPSNAAATSTTPTAWNRIPSAEAVKRTSTATTSKTRRSSKSDPPATTSKNFPKSSTTFGRSNSDENVKSTAKKKKITKALPANINEQDEIPIEIQHKLMQITDPHLTIKDRVALEIEMMKNVEEKRILLKFKSNFDRKRFLESLSYEEQIKQDKIQADIRLEEEKEAEFVQALQEKRERERQEELDRKRREKQAEVDAQRYKAKIIARDMTYIKDAALEAATVSVDRNIREKQLEEEENRKRIEDFRQNEGKHMHDAQRALREAMMEQKDPKSKSKLKRRN